MTSCLSEAGAPVGLGWGVFRKNGIGRLPEMLRCLIENYGGEGAIDKFKLRAHQEHIRNESELTR